MKSRTFFRYLLLLCFLSSKLFAQALQDVLPNRLIVGYWHNWTSSPNSLRLIQVPQAFDVINVAFAVPTTPLGATMRFAPEPSIYPTAQLFINDVDSLKRRGKKVLISIGGANDPVNVHDSADVRSFVSSMRSIIGTFGFDGMDIDLEGQSLLIASGDHDFRNPTSPLVRNFINAVVALTDSLPPGFMLTAAPETAFLQGGYSVYGGIWGAYLPVIHALRNRLTFVHVQHYNTGSMYGRDGNIYQPATADFHVAMADMLLAGFAVDVHGANIYFNPLAQEQVVIGLPASPSAAGSGYTPPAMVHTALDYLVLGRSFGGQYHLANPNGYPRFRGLMTWSINWDVYNNNLFSSSHRGYLDTLGQTTGVHNIASAPNAFVLGQNFPNPFNPVTKIGFGVSRSGFVSLKVFDVLGREVATLVDGEMKAGRYEKVFDGNVLASGVYFYKLIAGGFVATNKMLLLK